MAHYRPKKPSLDRISDIRHGQWLEAVEACVHQDEAQRHRAR